MNRNLIFLALLASLAACGDGQPFFDDSDPGEQPGQGGGVDTDGDGIPNNVDSDDDADGIEDSDEADTDNDGLIDDLDRDDDNDSVLDVNEADTDEDGLIDDNDPDDDNDGIPDVDENNGGVGGDPDLPPGTDRPTPSSGIFRQEARNESGGGFVNDVAYNAANDTFSVDGIAFDGNNFYTREDNAAVTTLSSPGGLATYAVYEASAAVPDGMTGVDVSQLQYRAIYGASGTTAANGEPTTQFAIVRTGSYVEYGFGGFVYERSGGVDLPTEGQATFSGDYAGMRVLAGATTGGQDLSYVTGSARVDIDFEDFNEGSGVKGLIFDRIYTDSEGNVVTGLPDRDLTFVVSPGTVTDSGEISGALRSQNEGEVYEDGRYYAIVGGQNATEIVGIVVVESDDPRFEGVTAQETGGFIVYR